MASLTSEPDSITFAGNVIFFSLTTDMNSVSQDLRVPTARGVNIGAYGVVVDFPKDAPNHTDSSPPDTD